MLQKRIGHGDYLLTAFPTDRELAAEFEVDTRTARRAVAYLVDSGLLVRQSNGRPVVASLRTGGERPLNVAMLAVAYPSPFTWRWQRAIQHLVGQRKWVFRSVPYTHMDEPVVQDVLAGFDGTFFALPGLDPSEHLLRTLRRVDRPVVFLDKDVSREGFPSLWLTSGASVTRLLEHLAAAGHTKIACLNTQPHEQVIKTRLAAWQEWVARRPFGGELIDHPVKPFESALHHAYRVAVDLVSRPIPGATAVLCVTSAAAKGLYRAMHERGMLPGRDLAVCSADDGAGEAPYFIPSLTALQDPDPVPHLSACLDWFARGGKSWPGEKLVVPSGGKLFIGDSTRGGVDRRDRGRRPPARKSSASRITSQ